MSLFSPAHERFRSRVRTFVEERFAPYADEWEQGSQCPLSDFRDLGREGFLGLSQARAHGGQELGFGYNVVLAEELAWSRMTGLTLSIIAQAHFFQPLLATLGTERQKEEFLAPAIRGEKIGALAATEPSGGTD